MGRAQPARTLAIVVLFLALAGCNPRHRDATASTSTTSTRLPTTTTSAPTTSTTASSGALPGLYAAAVGNNGCSSPTGLILASTNSGATIRRLTDVGPAAGIGSYSFNRDASTVWFITSPTTARCERPSPGQSCGSISSVSVVGGAVTPLHTGALNPAGTYGPVSVAPSPDGHFLAWGREECQENGEGGSSIKLVITDLHAGIDRVADAPAASLAWSPDGQTLTSAPATEFQGELYRYKIAPDGTPTLASHTGNLTGCPDDPSSVSSAIGWLTDPPFLIAELQCGNSSRVAAINGSGTIQKLLAMSRADEHVSAVSVRGSAILVEYSSASNPPGRRLDAIFRGATINLRYVTGRQNEQW